MKKTLTIVLAFVLVIAMTVAGTVAWMTSQDRAVNTFTVGNVKIDLTEPEWDKAGFTDGAEAYPGEPLAKDPTVENVGANPCFVRIKVTGLDQFGEKGAIALRYIDENRVYHDGYNTEDWTLYNGYYYYNHVLTSEKNLNDGYNDDLVTITPELFSQIVMPNGLDGTEEPEKIVVFAQAVQAQGAKPSYTEVKNMSVEQIDAWFTACEVGAPEL